MNLKEYLSKVDLSKPFVIVGNGESKNRYNFDTEKCNVICINKAIEGTNYDYGVTVWVHPDGMGKLYKELGKELVIIEQKEHRDLELGSGGTGNLFLNALIHNYVNLNIYLVGFDFSVEGRDFSSQKKNFRISYMNAGSRGNSIKAVMINHDLDFLPIATDTELKSLQNYTNIKTANVKKMDTAKKRVRRVKKDGK